jgi:hypothetical protein
LVIVIAGATATATGGSLNFGGAFVSAAVSTARKSVSFPAVGNSASSGNIVSEGTSVCHSGISVGNIASVVSVVGVRNDVASVVSIVSIDNVVSSFNVVKVSAIGKAVSVTAVELFVSAVTVAPMGNMGKVGVGSSSSRFEDAHSLAKSSQPDRGGVAGGRFVAVCDRGGSFAGTLVGAKLSR